MTVLPGKFAICQLDPGWPLSVPRGRFASVTVTGREVSLVCEEEEVPSGYRECAVGYRLLRVQGPLDLSLVGILASLSDTLAESGISVFCISTFETDYLLVKATDLVRAVRALRIAGHQVSDTPGRGVQEE